MIDLTEFNEAAFFLGDYENRTLSLEKFIKLIHFISNGYIDKNLA